MDCACVYNAVRKEGSFHCPSHCVQMPCPAAAAAVAAAWPGAAAVQLERATVHVMHHPEASSLPAQHLHQACRLLCCLRLSARTCRRAQPRLCRLLHSGQQQSGRGLLKAACTYVLKRSAAQRLHRLLQTEGHEAMCSGGCQRPRPVGVGGLCTGDLRRRTCTASSWGSGSACTSSRASSSCRCSGAKNRGSRYCRMGTRARMGSGKRQLHAAGAVGGQGPQGRAGRGSRA